MFYVKRPLDSISKEIKSIKVIFYQLNNHKLNVTFVFNPMNRLLFLCHKRQRIKPQTQILDIKFAFNDIEEELEVQYSLNNIKEFYECCNKIVAICQANSSSNIVITPTFDRFILNCTEIVNDIVKYDIIEQHDRTFSSILSVIYGTIIYQENIFDDLIKSLLTVLELSVGIYHNIKLDIAERLIELVNKLLSFNHIYEQFIEPQFEENIFKQALKTIQDVTYYQNQCYEPQINNQQVNQQNYQCMLQISHTKVMSTCCKVINLITDKYSFGRKHYMPCSKEIIEALKIIVSTIFNNFYQNRTYQNIYNQQSQQNNIILNLSDEEANNMFLSIAKLTNLILDDGTTNPLISINYYSIFVVFSCNFLQYVSIIPQMISMFLKLRLYFVLSQQEIIQLYTDGYFERYFQQLNMSPGHKIPKINVSVLELLCQIIEDQQQNEVLEDMMKKPQYFKVIVQSIMSTHQNLSKRSVDIFQGFLNKLINSQAQQSDIYYTIDRFEDANLFITLKIKITELCQKNVLEDLTYKILHLLLNICDYKTDFLINNDYIDLLLEIVDDYASQKCNDIAQQLLNRIKENHPEMFM